jgi:hypothetical protein
VKQIFIVERKSPDLFNACKKKEGHFLYSHAQQAQPESEDIADISAKSDQSTYKIII